MELIIENLTEKSCKKVLMVFEDFLSGVYMDITSDTITVVLTDSNHWCISTSAETTTIIKDMKKKVTLKNCDFTKIVIQ